MTMAVAQWLVEMTWQVALLGAIVWTIDRLLPRRVGPSPRIALWSLVLLKLVLPPTLSSPVSIAQLWKAPSRALAPAGSQSRAALGNGRAMPPADARPDFASREARAAAPRGDENGRDVRVGEVDDDKAALDRAGHGADARPHEGAAFDNADATDAVDAVHADAVAVAVARFPAAVALSPPAAIVLVWLAGALLTGGAMIWRYRRARRLWLDAVGGDDDGCESFIAHRRSCASSRETHRRRGRIGSARVRQRGGARRVPQVTRAARALRSAARRVGLRGPLPPIRVRAAHRSNAFESAAVVGFFRPTIVLPASLLAPARWRAHGRSDRPADSTEMVRHAAARSGRHPAQSTRTADPADAADTAGAATVAASRTQAHDAQRAQMLEHVLLHEVAHLARRDPQMHFACLLLQAIYWFHPIAWIARRRLETLREMACDRRVARALEGDVAAYRRTLLWLARPLVEGPAPTGLAFLARRSQLLMRLDALAHAGCGRASRQARALSALGCGVVLASCVPLHRSAPHAPASGPDAPDVAIATPAAADASTTPSPAAASPAATASAPAAPSSAAGAAAPPTAASSAAPGAAPASSTAPPSPAAPPSDAASSSTVAATAPVSVVHASATTVAAAVPSAAASAAAAPKAAPGREATDAIDLRGLRGSLQVRYTVLRALAARDGAPPD